MTIDNDLRQALDGMARGPVTPLEEAYSEVLSRSARRRRRRQATVAAAAVVGIALGSFGIPRVLDADLDEVAPADTGVRITSVTMAGSPLAARQDAAVVATSAGLFVWGGRVTAGDPGSAVPGTVESGASDGALYDARADTWSKLPPAPLSPRWSAVAVAVQGGVLVLGGRDAGTALTDGAVYDLSARSWTALPEGSVCPVAAGVGGRQTATVGGVLYAVAGCSAGPDDLAAYSLPDRTWTMTPEGPVDAPVDMAAWGSRVAMVGVDGRVAAYDGSAWRELPQLPDVTTLGVRLAAVGSRLFALVAVQPDDGDVTRVLELVDGQWEQQAETSAMFAEVPPAAIGHNLVWGTDTSRCSYDVSRTAVRCDGPAGPVRGAVLVPDQTGRRLFLWGGVSPAGKALGTGSVLSLR